MNNFTWFDLAVVVASWACGGTLGLFAGAGGLLWLSVVLNRKSQMDTLEKFKEENVFGHALGSIPGGEETDA